MKSNGRTVSPLRYVRSRRDQLKAHQRFTFTGDPQELPVMTSTVNCRACQACCKHYQRITLNAADSGEFLDIEVVDGKRQLRQKENGECIHLTDYGCSVYEHRPSGCRVYDCRDFVVTKVTYSNSELMNAAFSQWKLDTVDVRDRKVVEVASATAQDFIRRGDKTNAVTYGIWATEKV